jgi:hypothetical protein
VVVRDFEPRPVSPRTSRLRRSRRLRPSWRRADSNRRPPACKAGALPAELRPPVCLRKLQATTLHTAPTLNHFTAPNRQSPDARRGHERFHGTKCRRRAAALHLSTRRTASDEELVLPAARLTVKLGREQAASITGPLRARGPSTRNPRAELRTYLVGWCTGTAPTGLGVFDGRGRQYLPGRGGDGEAVETSQVGVGDQPGLPIALFELDRW